MWLVLYIYSVSGVCSLLEKSFLVFALINSLTTKIIFTWWTIFIAIFRAASEIRIKLGCHQRTVTWNHSYYVEWALVHGLLHRIKCLWHLINCVIFYGKSYIVALDFFCFDVSFFQLIFSETFVALMFHVFALLIHICI